MSKTEPTIDKSLVLEAIKDGVSEYIADRRASIDEFVDTNYSFKGAWHINKNAMGWDIAKAPANLLWMPIHFLGNVGSLGLSKAGLTRTSQLLARVPSGFRTKVESEVEWLIYTRFLHLPIIQKHRQSEQNLLLEFILKQPVLTEYIGDKLDVINEISQYD